MCFAELGCFDLKQHIEIGILCTQQLLGATSLSQIQVSGFSDNIVNFNVM